MGDVTFDTMTFSHFGAVVSGSEGSWAQPTRRVTKAQVYGMSGDLIVEAGEFNNVGILSTELKRVGNIIELFNSPLR